MKAISIPVIVTVGICICVGIYYLALHLYQRKGRLSLSFALVCFSVAVYNATCAGLYNASSVLEGIYWQTGNFAGIGLIAVSFSIYVFTLTKRGNWRLLAGILVFFAACILTIVLFPGSWTLSVLNPAIKRFTLGGAHEVVYYEAALGVVPTAVLIGSVLSFLYLLYILKSHYIESDALDGKLLVISIYLFFVFTINDVLVGLGVYHSLYLVEYGFMIIIVMMANGMLRRFVKMHHSLASTNTELMAANTTLNETYEMLKWEKELLSVIMYSMGDGIIVSDRTGMILFVNRMAEEIIGAVGFVGNTLDDMLLLKDEIRQEEILPSSLLDCRDNPWRSRSLTCRLVSRHGSERLVAMEITPLAAGDGETGDVVITLSDITIKKRVETELFMSSRIESLTLLAGTVAHDFNNILTVLSNIMGLIRNNLPGNLEGALRNIATAERAVEKATLLAQRLINLSQGWEVRKKQGNIVAVVSEAAALAVNGSTVALRITGGENMPKTFFDEVHVTQLVQNLVINAQQAMGDAGTITVDLQAVEIFPEDQTILPAGQYIRVAVEDTGVGIPREHLGRIFDPYFTTKSKGSGLGLASCYSIARRHGGNIQVFSELGRGTRFEVYLPAYD